MNLNENIIQILPDYIANQIAAGEVVQRPESVIKELVENSIDAGATSVVVIVKGSGKNLITVIDNGKGMSKEDLALAPKRHATSKIKTSEDLERIMTFGFRGEALASITAVAHLEIRSRREIDEVGYKLTSEPNKEIVIEPINTEVGTQIYVRNLFYNVPARRKFLKSDLTEFRYISDTMIRFALSYPQIRFTFYDDDSKIFDAKPASLEERITDILGSGPAGALMKVDFSDHGVRVSGYLGQPHLAKQTAANQYLFLNKRTIQSKNLSHAVYSAFEHLLERNYKPFYILNIEIDPEKVDVNVHPQKHEVKFEDEKFIYSILRKSANDALRNNDLTGEIAVVGKEAMSPFETVKFINDDGLEEKALVNKFTGEIVDSKPNFSSSSSNYKPSSSRSYDQPLDFNQARNSAYNLPSGDIDKDSAFDILFGKGQFQRESGSSGFVLDSREELAVPSSNNENKYYYQVHNKYIFVQNDKGVLIIDQHNAHERVLYEKAIKAMNREFANSQELLFPISLDLSPTQAAIVKEIADDLQSLGFRFEFDSEMRISLFSVPLDLLSGGEEKAFIEIVEDFAENNRIRHTDKRESLAATFACKSAIKTGKPLSQPEMKSLEENLFKCALPYVCPHGRPIILEFTLNELDKKFGRSS